MTREELIDKIADVLYGDCSRFTEFDAKSDRKVCRILMFVDKYILSESFKNKEFKVDKIEPSQPIFPVPTCPKCGSKEYTISSNSAGNVRCSKCGRYFFICF